MIAHANAMEAHMIDLMSDPAAIDFMLTVSLLMVVLWFVAFFAEKVFWFVYDRVQARKAVEVSDEPTP